MLLGCILFIFLAELGYPASFTKLKVVCLQLNNKANCMQHIDVSEAK